MIKYNYEVSVNENRAKLNKDIFLFRGNRNIHYYFSIKGARFAFEKEGDLIENANAIYAAVTVIKPNGVEVANAIAPVEDGLIHLKVTEDLIDEEVEVGDFDLVFDLFDDNEGAVTIPKIKGQFHVQERPCTTSIGTLSGNVNVVNQAVVDLAIATQENEQLIVVDDDGKYVKTTWVKGDKISIERLNKIEEGIEKNSTQYKDIENLFTTEQVNNNFIIKYNNKVVATIPINGSAINYGSIITSCSETLEINEGNTLDIMVYLSSKPTNNQSIIITTSNSNITTSITEMTFTPDNYSTEQTLTITATHDVSSFDDKSCLLTFASENVESVNISITVKNTDTQQSDYITDGLSLYYDFTETPEDPTTVYDKVNNLSIYNVGYKAENYTSNGVYLVNGGGANSFKFGSSSVDIYDHQKMPEFSNFLNKIKEGNGLTVEYFGQYVPVTIMYMYNTGLNIGGSGGNSGGYLTENSPLGGANLKYLNTSNETVAINLSQIDKVTKDGREIRGYSADNNADIYVHLVITADETGKLTWYLNGNAMINTATATDFASWDYDTMFKATYGMILRGGAEDTNRLIYPTTSLKIYNRALTQDEIKTNLEYEISRTNFINSASVTP